MIKRSIPDQNSPKSADNISSSVFIDDEKPTNGTQSSLSSPPAPITTLTTSTQQTKTVNTAANSSDELASLNSSLNQMDEDEEEEDDEEEEEEEDEDEDEDENEECDEDDEEEFSANIMDIDDDVMMPNGLTSIMDLSPETRYISSPKEEFGEVYKLKRHFINYLRLDYRV